MRKGPAPKPSALRRLAGGGGHRPLNDREPTPPAVDAAFEEPPPELGADAVAATEWRRVAPLLRQCKVLTEADRAVLIAVCLEWSMYLTATAKVQQSGMVVKTPNGYPLQNPYLSIARGALAACSRLWCELGLTPASRSRVKTDSSGSGEGEDFSEFDLPPTLPKSGNIN